MTPEISGAIALIFKLFTLFGLGIYCIFAFVIVRQEHLMANVLEEKFEPLLKLVTYIHLVASVAVFWFSLVLL